MTTTTQDKIKELRDEEKAKMKEVAALAFVTKDESGYVKFELDDNLPMELDFKEWEKEHKNRDDGEEFLDVNVRVEVIGDSFCGVNLEPDDFQKIANAQWEARQAARKVAYIRKERAKQVKINNKEKELEEMKNQKEPKEEGFIDMTVFADDYWYL